MYEKKILFALLFKLCIFLQIDLLFLFLSNCSAYTKVCSYLDWHLQKQCVRWWFGLNSSPQLLTRWKVFFFWNSEHCRCVWLRFKKCCLENRVLIYASLLTIKRLDFTWTDDTIFNIFCAIIIPVWTKNDSLTKPVWRKYNKDKILPKFISDKTSCRRFYIYL